MTEIKICGLTLKEEADVLIKERVEYAGIVLGYPKSKRNNGLNEAAALVQYLRKKENDFFVKTVAVTVSPTLSMLEQIEKIGFDFIQIHGTLSEEVLHAATIPLFRAVSIERADEIERAKGHPKIVALLYDGAVSGSGEVFDWDKLNSYVRKRDGENPYVRDQMCILAGGLNAENVREAIRTVNPHVVDVSSGVEYDKSTVGKDPNKIKQFIKAVRYVDTIESNGGKTK